MIYLRIFLLLFCAACMTQAAATSLCYYTFPASYNGTDTAVIDQGPLGNNATASSSINAYSFVTPFDPTGSSATDGSFDCTVPNDFKTDAVKLLDNNTVAAAGGYTFDVWFKWDGTAGGAKIIDYAGTEVMSLNSGTLIFGAVNNPGYNWGSISTNSLQPDTWYHAVGVFDTEGNSVDGDGGISGKMRLFVDEEKVAEMNWGKGTYGDGLNRKIGFGTHPTSAEKFQGLLYNPHVLLGVREPAQVPPKVRQLYASKWLFYDKIQVTWSNSPTATHYALYRNTNDNSSAAGALATNITGTSYDDTAATAAVRYYYWVKAGNDKGFSHFSPGDYGYRSAPGQPLAPADVTATDGAYTDKVRVSWTASTSTNVVKYRVLRSDTNDIDTAVILDSTIPGTSYDDTTAIVPRTYFYWVKAGTASLWSGESNSDDGFISAPHDPPFIPWPQSVTTNPGSLTISSSSRIVVSDPSLLPLGNVFSFEMLKAFGLTLPVMQGTSAAGDIYLVLSSDPSITGEVHTVTVDSQATVEGGNYYAVAMGTATLLQSMKQAGADVTIPLMTVRDWPFSAFRGVMVDVGRQLNEIEDIKHIVVMCRLYKIRYLQLHLTDNQGWTFPSTNFPLLGTANTAAHGGVPPRKFTREELQNLVQYADERGVIIIPEIDWPGHSAAMLRAQGSFFDPAGVGVVNVATEDIYNALDDIIGEVFDVFYTTPYFHFGADEVGLGSLYSAYSSDPYVVSNGITSGHSLFTHFMERMVEFCEKRGKKAMAWEGHNAVNDTLRKILMVEWSTKYVTPQQMINYGYTMVNAAWCPLYVVENQTWITTENVYDWNLYTWGNYPRLPRLYEEAYWYTTAPTDKVIGGMYCSWENPGDFQVHGLRPLVPPMSERIWNPDAAHRIEDFAIRYQATDALYEQLLDTIPEPAGGLLIFNLLILIWRKW